ncbi:MAG: DUF4383 domain-containing protein [Verrucomicrobiota bacterium]|nr:DUF4383 domain-containing protein [Verrucomicrobiota bacterium]
MKQNSLIRGFAIIVGALLVIEGICEQFTPVLFGVLTSNHLHGAVHILLGIVGTFTGLRGGARSFCIFLGTLLLVVDLLWFLPTTNELIVRLFNVNQPVAMMNLIVALVSLAVAFSSGRTALNER